MISEHRASVTDLPSAPSSTAGQFRVRFSEAINATKSTSPTHQMTDNATAWLHTLKSAKQEHVQSQWPTRYAVLPVICRLMQFIVQISRLVELQPCTRASFVGKWYFVRATLPLSMKMVFIRSSIIMTHFVYGDL